MTKSDGSGSAALVRGVIFDMDGVLVDSYGAHLESWIVTAEAYGQRLTEAQFQQTFGRTSREIIRTHWGEGALSEEQIKRFDDRKEALYSEIVAEHFPEMGGARDLIHALHAAGFRIAIGSSGPPENIELAISQLKVQDQIDAIVTGRDVTKGKPDPQVFLIAAQRLGLPPEQCAVIEDATPGIAAANAAGMVSVALLSTGHTPEDAREADHVVDRLNELSPERLGEWIDQAPRKQ